MLLVALATPVYPCGGPEHYPIDAPLVGADGYLQALETIDDFDFRRRPELRFLYPFLAGARSGASAMWMHSYTDAVWNPVDGVDSTAVFPVQSLVDGVDAAARSGDARALESASRALLDGALDLPAVVADEVQPAVRRAVEALEVIAASRQASASDARGVSLTPELVRRLYGETLVADRASLPAWAREVVALRSVARDSMVAWGDRHPGTPREGSVRFVGLQLAMRHGIPDGWARETRDTVPAERWRSLAAMHDEWMQRFPSHPLAPWVGLSRLRLAYFAGDTAAAWDVALSLYAAHPWRALDEMRFLLRQSMYPPSLDDRRIDDRLRAALLGEVPLDRDRWTREWERARSSTEGWATAARARLLWQAAGDRGGVLASADAALIAPGVALSPLADALRLVALVRRGQVLVAMRVADSLGAPRSNPSAIARSAEIDSIVAPIRVQLLLAGRRWRDALRSTQIAAEARRYLVQVVAPDSVLDSLAHEEDPLLSTASLRTRALRRAASGDWQTASTLLSPRDTARATAWRRTQALAADSSRSGRLAFARHMRAHNGRLFWGNDKVWYRSLNWRLRAIGDSTTGAFNPVLPWTADDERRAIGRHFLESFEMYYAVRAYADFLSRVRTGDARRAPALREANQAYNWLINWDNNNSTFWADELEAEGIGRTIRRAGRR